MKILAVLVVIFTLHSCTAPFYSVQPNELHMVEETGKHTGGVSMGNSLLFNYLQLQGQYGYSLPYGVRLTADLGVASGFSFASSDSETAGIRIYGAGLGYYRRLGSRFQWETNLKRRRLLGSFSIIKNNAADPFYKASYSGYDTNLYTGLRLMIAPVFHFEFSYGYQWLDFEPMDVTLQSMEETDVLRDYNRLTNSDRHLVGLNLALTLKNVDLILYSTTDLYPQDNNVNNRINAILVGTRVTAAF